MLLQGPMTQIRTVSIGEKRQPVNHTTVSKTLTSNTSTSKPTTGTRWAVRMFLVLRCVWSLALKLKLKLCETLSQETTWRSQEVSKGVWHGEEGPVVHSVPLEEGLPALHWLRFMLYPTSKRARSTDWAPVSPAPSQSELHELRCVRLRHVVI